MTVSEKRVVPLGDALGGTLLEVTFAWPNAMVALRAFAKSRPEEREGSELSEIERS
jgi:hypothetical protein